MPGTPSTPTLRMLSNNTKRDEELSYDCTGMSLKGAAGKVQVDASEVSPWTPSGIAVINRIQDGRLARVPCRPNLLNQGSQVLRVGGLDQVRDVFQNKPRWLVRFQVVDHAPSSGTRAACTFLRAMPIAAPFVEQLREVLARESGCLRV